MNADFRWLTSAQAAEYCEVSRKTFNGMVKSIPIPFARPAGPRGDRRFFRVQLDAALRSTVENLPAA
jgi:excisionase family DNA binding protein